MSVMSIRIADQKRKAIKAIAFLEGKTIIGILEELIVGYIKDRKELTAVSEIMKFSERSFMEWNDQEDEIYNDL